MSSSPLFIMVAELIVTFWPIAQFGCCSACSTVAVRICSGGPRAERPARRRQDDAVEVALAVGAERLKHRVVLGVSRQHRRTGSRWRAA